ncbi:MAG: hypothetical protein FWG32_07135 [Oscillospiraceae bacterium]|nr:hypothetical protein [Oscillospiraceae bacterium]
MTETVMNTKAFPDILFKLIPTERVCVKEMNGVIQLIPVIESADCPLLGLTADSGLTVDRFLAMTHNETEMGK